MDQLLNSMLNKDHNGMHLGALSLQNHAPNDLVRCSWSSWSMARRINESLSYLTRDHDDVIKWKHFPRYWPFVWGMYRPPMKIPSQRPVTRSFDICLICALNKRLSKQSWGCWFETPSRSLWRRCNIWFMHIKMAILVYVSSNKLTKLYQF